MIRCESKGAFALIAPKYDRGFTLLELSLVLVVVGILANMFLAPMGAQVERVKRDRTEVLLDQVEQALIGFAIAHGRLPCPAPVNGPAIERSDCPAGENHGLVPATTLGIDGHRNQDGALLDHWGQPIRYAVSAADHSSRGRPGSPDFTTSDEIREVGMGEVASELVICSENAGTCARNDLLANQVPVVFYSLGKPGEASLFESENIDDDSVFLDRPYSQAAGLSYDDMLRWIPENILLYRLLQAGVLP